MSASPRSDVYARVTDAIVDAIEAGTGTWRMPWHHSGADVTRPTNVASGNPYRGINTVSLWATAYGSGYASGVWGTYRQWQALGAQVRKGEHASLGVLWKEFRAKDDDAGDDDDHRRLFAKAFSLFNADQVDGYAPEPGPDLPESERLAAAEAFIAALGIDTVYGSASAYYHIVEDRIHMPDFSAFHDAHGFYATHIHEAAHASGAAHRLDRDFSAKWATHALAMEEATAELTASFLLADLGIAHEPRPDHAAYIASWLQLLKDEPRAIFTAASKAQAAADWMHARQPWSSSNQSRAADPSRARPLRRARRCAQLRPLTSGRRWRGGADFSGLPRCGSGRRSLLGPPRRAASPASPSCSISFRPSGCGPPLARASPVVLAAHPRLGGSHGALGAVMEATMVFTFQPPLSAGLSGYVAEMGSAFLCASLGIVPTVRHADYIGAWLEVLREDNRALVRAASMASKAADWLLARHRGASHAVAEEGLLSAQGGPVLETVGEAQGSAARNAASDAVGDFAPGSEPDRGIDTGRAAA